METETLLETTARQYRECLAGVLQIAQGDDPLDDKIVRIVARIHSTLWAFPEPPRDEERSET